MEPVNVCGIFIRKINRISGKNLLILSSDLLSLLNYNFLPRNCQFSRHPKGKYDSKKQWVPVTKLRHLVSSNL